MGPLDLVELAAELRYGNIGTETPVRRKDETTWTIFRELPEFATAQGMSVEVIARHLAERERAGAAQERRLWRPNLSIIILIVVFFVGVLASLFLMPSLESVRTKTPAHLTARAPESQNQAPAAWPRMAENGFSAECPVQLQRVATVKPGVISYRGMTSTAGFGIDLASVPGTYTDEEYQFALSDAESILLDGLHANVSSNIEVALNGYHGRDFLFTHLAYVTRFSGGARFLGGDGKVAVAWVTAKSDAFAPQDIDRFLKSFELQ